MTNASPYFDIRSDFFKQYFAAALPYDKYLETAKPQHRQRWESLATTINLSPVQKQLLGSMSRKMNILVLSGTWCGDCARQGPMLKAIADSSNKIDLRFIDNGENPKLQDELMINGAKKVPVVVVLSEDYFEIARFGDRHLSVYRRKLEQETGPACDAGILPPSKEELDKETSEWMDFFERAHAVLRLAPMLRRRYND